MWSLQVRSGTLRSLVVGESSKNQITRRPENQSRKTMGRRRQDKSGRKKSNEEMESVIWEGEKARKSAGTGRAGEKAPPLDRKYQMYRLLRDRKKGP